MHFGGLNSEYNRYIYIYKYHKGVTVLTEVSPVHQAQHLQYEEDQGCQQYVPATSQPANGKHVKKWDDDCFLHIKENLSSEYNTNYTISGLWVDSLINSSQISSSFCMLANSKACKQQSTLVHYSKQKTHTHTHTSTWITPTPAGTHMHIHILVL